MDALFEIPADQPSPSETLRTKPKDSSQYVSSIWSFGDAPSDHIYRWYGTLPSPLVARLVSLYCEEGSLFVDPFAGSGTTLVCAAAAGRTAVGADVNPLACMLARVRTRGTLRQRSVADALDAVRRARPSGRVLRELQGERYAYMRKWFRDDTLGAVASLFERIAKAKAPAPAQLLLFVVASQLVREVANVDPRCTHHLVTKLKHFVDPGALLADRVTAANSLLPERSSTASVLQASATDPAWYPSGSKFVLMHPPYLGVIHYHLIHRLATELLHAVKVTYHPEVLRPFQFEYESIKQEDVSTDHDRPYAEFVANLATTAEKVVDSGDRAAVIIGDQRHKGLLRHPLTDYIREFEGRGFDLEENFIWVLQNNGGMHVLRRGHFIDHNYILIFTRR